MNNFNCIIVDDEQQSVDLLSYSLGRMFKNIRITGTANTWAGAQELLRETSFDILFLDISINGRNGMDLLKYLPPSRSEIIFVTAFPDYALDAFKLRAGGYIVKPIDEAELVATVDKAIERLQHKYAAESPAVPELVSKVGIPNGNAIDYVPTSDIIYLQAAHAYTKVVTGQEALTSSYNIGKYRQLLDPRLFYQVHRSYLVNLNHIARYETSGYVIMDNTTVIPVARNFREDLLKQFQRAKHQLGD